MAKRPKIIVSSLDASRLEEMIKSLGKDQLPSVDELQIELDRPKIVDPKKIPPDVVTMNSTVQFKVESTQKEFSLTLVYPKNAAASEGNISILAPVGSALLGLKEGDQISWPKPGGGELEVRIIKVSYQPERAGDFRL